MFRRKRIELHTHHIVRIAVQSCKIVGFLRNLSSCIDIIKKEYVFVYTFSTKGLLWLSWFVKGKGDIADFYISVKDIDDRNTIKEFHIPYDQRTFNISLNNINSNNIEVCLLSKDSKGKINKWDKHQCFVLRSEWKVLNKKCYRSSGRHCDIFNYKSNSFVKLQSNEANKIYHVKFIVLLIVYINVFTLPSMLN